MGLLIISKTTFYLKFHTFVVKIGKKGCTQGNAPEGTTCRSFKSTDFKFQCGRWEVRVVYTLSHLTEEQKRCCRKIVIETFHRKLLVIGSLRFRTDFWDRHGANILTRYKGKYGEKLFGRSKKRFWRHDGSLAAVSSYIDKDNFVTREV